jgi:hypothetical protein
MADVRESTAFLQSALRDLQTRLNSRSDSQAGLEDFKSALDTVRTTVLAVLAAADSSDYQQYIRRFRLRRAVQVCRSVLSGFDDGTITRQTPGVTHLHATLREMLAKFND